MINVELLEKRYGPVTALDGISFEVPKGQVLGFLGPNGAGKTTTMKILTGFLKPDGGRATVAGLDVVTDSLEVRRRIGYLPESTPLYAEMRVDDYLSFAADIRGVPRSEKRAKMNRVIDACGLSMVVKKNIVELSKGYRQRLGLAQAMVHDPELLILDEPTSGLDPNQIVEVRELVKHLGTERTVILSTHYLQEVEATCSRILIIAKGRIVADGTLESLTAGEAPGAILVKLTGTGDPAGAALRQVHGVRQVEATADDGVVRYRIQAEPGVHVEEAIFDLAATNRWKLVELSRAPATLETVFRNKTRGEPIHA
jgi:ABC-2 type transport system ATP-binding protein